MPASKYTDVKNRIKLKYAWEDTEVSIEVVYLAMIDKSNASMLMATNTVHPSYNTNDNPDSVIPTIMICCGGDSIKKNMYTCSYNLVGRNEEGDTCAEGFKKLDDVLLSSSVAISVVDVNTINAGKSGSMFNWGIKWRRFPEELLFPLDMDLQSTFTKYFSGE